ncbi:zf-DHHC-domain-containing protein [Myriangium duriaei CBS 260.36]|uniref:Palmitoyltransferase n=1 Tax=Myriangium duriaei CBS 260.36 TaxID=1168546 RepID=A0A9P4MD01_9PEZI|nr:zf-DHHC-domain-containing protein [Myriangium duriaei CBS 260.36]
MELLVKVLIGVGVISGITFILLFGQLPALRKTPIGWLQRLLAVHIPYVFDTFDQRFTGGILVRSIRQLTNYLFYKRNPVVLIIFLGILSTATFLFLSASWSQLSNLQLLPVLLIVPAPYIFTYLCATSTSIYITAANHARRMTDYPYDHALFHPGISCTTCKLPKPARSKHCSLCEACVSRSDHHCPWVNNCLGRENYRWFLALLLSLWVLESYGAYLGYTVLSPWLKFSTLSGLSFRSAEFWNRLALIIMSATNAGGLSIAGVTILAFTTAPLPLGLLGYHVYLVWAGTTTNENSKWDYLGEDMGDGIVWKGKRTEVTAYKRRLAESRGEVAKVVEEVHVDWPIETDQVVVTTTDGLPPRGCEHLYEQVFSLKAVENLYDLGFWDNLMYVLRGR